MQLSQTKIESCWLNTESCGPLRQRFGYPIECNQMIGSSVVILDAFCSPSTVCRFVIAIIVNTVYRMLYRRTWANIPKERRKRIFPAITHHNTTTSIVVVRLEARIIAAAKYITPASVFRRLLTATSVAMCCMPTTFAASPYLAGPQLSAINSNNISTFAKATPISCPASIVIIRQKLQDGQFSVDIPYFLFYSPMTCGRIGFSHENLQYRFEWLEQLGRNHVQAVRIIQDSPICCKEISCV